jgi:hypoxanthine phosphoribosyltransferase
MSNLPSPPSILLSEREIQKRVAELALEIRRDRPGALHLVAVLKGAFVFLADLIRQMPDPGADLTLDFIAVASYAQGTTTSGEVRMIADLAFPIDGRDVLVVEDIVDTGTTLVYLQDVLRARNPRSLATACLLSKPARRRVDVQVDYVGFTIEDCFVVGYGLDYEGRYRNLPYLAVVEA